MHISILIPKAAILGSLEGTRQLFTQVNQVCKMRGMPPLFKVQMVGLEKATPAAGGLYTVNADVLLQDVKKTNLIIIPAIDGELKNAIDQNSAFIPWIIKQYQGGAEVASLCLGAFLLASTGLLKGRKVATHWGAANEFRKMFPDVELITERIITEEQGIYSSGGAFSYLNLILHLIDKYAGHDMAVLCAKIFAIEIERDNQASFIIFQGQKEHDDEPVKKAQEYIETNYQDKTTVDELAGMFAIGRRSFERRFKKATDNTVAEYIQRVKVEAAKKELEASRKTVNEIMYEVGYSDIKAFRTTFKKITGLSPLEYKHKYNKDAMAMA